MGLFSRSSQSNGDNESGKDDSELIVIVDRTVDPHIVIYHDPRSLLSEQYRHFRTNLMALNKDGSPKSLVFTSSNKGEGKSVTIANIAVSLVECDNTRVCMVDADFRAPMLGRMFGIKSGPGLSEMISEGLSLDRVLVPTKIDNLSLIRAGAEPPSSTELLGSERLSNLISALKQDFQYVLFDTPPVMPYTDACVLGARCNGTVFVVKMDETQKSRVEKAVKMAESAGARVIGTFLAAIRPSEREEGKGYYCYREESDANE